MKTTRSSLLAAILTGFLTWGGLPLPPAGATEPDIDAELLAMEISGELLPPPDLYERIHGDLEAIRAAYPGMALVRHWAPWIPGDLIVGMEIGRYADLEELNQQFGPVEVDQSAIGSRVILTLHFEKRYNPECLAPLYAAVDGVEWAEPDYCGVSASYPGPDDISVDIPRYTFVWYTFTWPSADSTRSSPQGHIYVFEVTDGVPSLVEKQGPPIPTSRPYIVDFRRNGQGSLIFEWRGPRCDYSLHCADVLDAPEWKEVDDDMSLATRPWEVNITPALQRRFYRIVAIP